MENVLERFCYSTGVKYSMNNRILNIHTNRDPFLEDEGFVYSEDSIKFNTPTHDKYSINGFDLMRSNSSISKNPQRLDFTNNSLALSKLKASNSIQEI